MGVGSGSLEFESAPVPGNGSRIQPLEMGVGIGSLEWESALVPWNGSRPRPLGMGVSYGPLEWESALAHWNGSRSRPLGIGSLTLFRQFLDFPVTVRRPFTWTSEKEHLDLDEKNVAVRNSRPSGHPIGAN